MAEESANAITHEEVEAEKREEIDWPQFFVTGEREVSEDFVSAYWKVDGPNGPVSYRNENSGPYPTTMIDLALEGYLSFRAVERHETPWGDDGDLCEVCGDPVDEPELTSDSHPVGPNLWTCGDCHV